MRKNVAVEPPGQMRLFVAVDMPQTVVDEVRRIQDYFKKQELFNGRYTKPEDVHITMKFLGEVSTDLALQIDQALKTISCNGMHAHLSSLDVFSAGSKIKILFLNIICPELAVLAKQIDTALADLFAIEQRPFVSHATLARVKAVENREKLCAAINQFTVNKIEFTIDQFVLKQSELSTDGPTYTDIARYKLY